MSDNKIVMRSKTAISIIAFLAAFGISVALTPQAAKPTFAPYVKTGCTETANARKITKLLEQDIENGRVRDRKINGYDESERYQAGRFSNFVLAVNGYTSASANIDDSDLPGDFKTVWRRHMQAWRNHSDYLNEMGDSSGKTRRSAYSRKYSEQNKEISDTWDEVLNVARKYDADIPAGAY
jgi:hypothetical protein